MSSRPVHRTFRIAAAGLALAMLAAACDGDVGSTPASSGGDDTLASFLGWEDEGLDDAAQEAQWRDQQAEIQESIRACMAEQGFEYVPVDHTAGTMTVNEEWDEEEYVRSNGFGITTWYGNDDDVVMEETMEESPDPNWEIVEAMSEGEQQAYYEALYGSEEEQREGSEVEYDEETGEEIGWMSSGFGAGCDGQAHEEAYGGNNGAQELWEELQPAFDELYARVEADPRIVEWNESWSKCMAEAGHDHASPQAMQDQVQEDFQGRMDAILGPDGGYVDPFDGWSESDIEAFFEESSDDEIDAFFQQHDQGSSLDDDAQAALEALQQEEIELALTDLECRDGDEFWAVYQEVSETYEGAFIAENRELLEQIREAEGG